MRVAYSTNDVPIRLTDERWEHITGNKPYMESHSEQVLEAIENPSMILRGYGGSLVAILSLSRNSYLHVVYREIGQTDGFIITAFIAQKVNRRQKIWP